LKNKMKIGLIYTLEEVYDDKSLLPDPLSIHFGLAYIISSLQGAGYSTDLLVVHSDVNMTEKVKNFIKEKKPKIIGYTSVATQYPVVSEIAKIVKTINKDIYNVIGGSHAILDKERVAENRDFDAVCIGEGEKAIVLLARAVENGVRPSAIPNLWIRDRKFGILEKNDNEPFNQDLDVHPYIDRKIWDPWIASHPIKTQHLLMARGCPFKCTYCANHVLSKTQEGRQLRFRSAENIRGELLEIIENYPEVDSVYFEVETFGANIKYAKDFCEGLAKFNDKINNRLQYGINLAVTRKIAQNADILTSLMKKAGFTFVNIGLESGSEKVRKTLKRPVYTNQDLIVFSESARKAGIRVNLYVLIGLPGETPVDFKETVEAARNCIPYNCSLSKFYPYPGTVLHQVAKDGGYIDDDPETILERRKTVIKMKDFPPWRIEYEYLMFHYRVFKAQLPLYIRVLYLIRKTLFLSPKLNSVYRHFASNTLVGRKILQALTRTQFSK